VLAQGLRRRRDYSARALNFRGQPGKRAAPLLGELAVGLAKLAGGHLAVPRFDTKAKQKARWKRYKEYRKR
jgi:hypothetical protein